MQNIYVIIAPKPFNFSFFFLTGHFAVGEYVKEEYIDGLRLMKEDIYWEQYVAMMPKSSPILDSYNMHILRTLETGLPAVWESQV